MKIKKRNRKRSRKKKKKEEEKEEKTEVRLKLPCYCIDNNVNITSDQISKNKIQIYKIKKIKLNDFNLAKLTR